MGDWMLFAILGFATLLVLGTSIAGIVYLVKFFRTRQRKHLWLGLSLLLVLPSILTVLWFFLLPWLAGEVRPFISCYMIGTIGMGPVRRSDRDFLRLRTGLIGKFKDRIPADALGKISRLES